jgi:hypothetical protein
MIELDNIWQEVVLPTLVYPKTAIASSKIFKRAISPA